MENNIRSKNWFITINPNASCYNELENIIINSNIKNYAYIKHSAENESENDNHVHLCIEYTNQTRFSTLLNTFKGAHIEQMQYKNMSYQYLIHKNDNDKKQYSIDDVITNDKEYFINMLDSDEYIKIDYDSLINEINNGNNTIIGLTKVFGYYQMKNNLSMVKAFINESQYVDVNENLKNQYQEVVQLNTNIVKERDELKAKYDNALKELKRLEKIINDNKLLPF